MSILFNVLAVMRFFARHAACWNMKRKKGRKKKMSNVAKKYIWSFFNPAAGRVAIVTDEKDVAKAVEIYKELGYKNIDKIEFVCEVYAEEKAEEDKENE
jgi:hypothetical protein